MAGGCIVTVEVVSTWIWTRSVRVIFISLATRASSLASVFRVAYFHDSLEQCTQHAVPEQSILILSFNNIVTFQFVLH